MYRERRYRGKGGQPDIQSGDDSQLEKRMKAQEQELKRFKRYREDEEERKVEKRRKKERKEDLKRFEKEILKQEEEKLKPKLEMQKKELEELKKQLSKEREKDETDRLKELLNAKERELDRFKEKYGLKTKTLHLTDEPYVATFIKTIFNGIQENKEIIRKTRQQIIKSDQVKLQTIKTLAIQKAENEKRIAKLSQANTQFNKSHKELVENNRRLKARKNDLEEQNQFLLKEMKRLNASVSLPVFKKRRVSISPQVDLQKKFDIEKGPKGGLYYYNTNGNKSYLNSNQKKKCIKGKLPKSRSGCPPEQSGGKRRKSKRRRK